MSLVSDNYLQSLTTIPQDSEKGSMRKLVQLLARLGEPNSIVGVSKISAANGKAWSRLPSAKGFRLRGDNNTGQSLVFRRFGSNTADVAATLSTNLTGANNDLTLTAVAAGAQGNNITLALVDPAGNNQALAVTVTGTAISVSLATGAGGAITSTAAQVMAAIQGNVNAAALVTVANKAGNDGTGVVTALGAANLTGGADTAVATVTVASGAAIALPCVSNAQEWEFQRTDQSNTQVTLQAMIYNTV